MVVAIVIYKLLVPMVIGFMSRNIEISREDDEMFWQDFDERRESNAA